jgi:hypothetical protein
VRDKIYLPLYPNVHTRFLIITDFRLSRWFIIGSVPGSLRRPLGLVSTIEELLGTKSSGSDLERLEYVCRDPLRWPRGTLYPQKLAPISPTSSSRSIGIVRSRTQPKELQFFFSLVPGSLHRLNAGNIADILALNTASILRVEHLRRWHYVRVFSNRQHQLHPPL